MDFDNDKAKIVAYADDDEAVIIPGMFLQRTSHLMESAVFLHDKTELLLSRRSINFVLPELKGVILKLSKQPNIQALFSKLIWEPNIFHYTHVYANCVYPFHFWC